MKHRVALGALLVSLLVLGCSRTVVDGTPSVRHRVLVVYGLEETADVYDVDHDSLFTQVFVTGNTPNSLLATGDRFYLVNSGFTGVPSVQVVDARNLEVLREVPLPNGSNPMQMEILDQNAYVTSFTRNQVYRLDEAWNLVDSVTVGKALDGIVALDGRLYVVATFYDLATYQSDTGKLYVLTPDLEVTDSLLLSLNPSKIATDGQALYVLGGDWALGAGYLLKIDPQSLQVVNTANITQGVPGALDLEQGRAYVVGWGIPGIVVVDLATLQVTDFVDLSEQLEPGTAPMDIDVDGDVAYVTVFSNDPEAHDALLIVTLQGHTLERVTLGAGRGAQLVHAYELEE